MMTRPQQQEDEKEEEEEEEKRLQLDAVEPWSCRAMALT